MVIRVLLSVLAALAAFGGSVEQLHAQVSEERLKAIEDRVTVALEVKDERIEVSTKQIENLYITLQIAGVFAGLILVVFTVRDFAIRARERSRQQGIDELVKEMLSLQRLATQQQLDAGSLRLAHEERNLGEQVTALQRVNAVIEVVGKTLEFRQQQEEKVARALEGYEELTAERLKTRQTKLAHAVSINDNFRKMSRMEFATLTEEQRKRGLRLIALVEDLDLASLRAEHATLGPLLLTCGAVSYYDNDVIEAKEYLDRALDLRADDHAGALEADSTYRTRFALIYYFRSLVHKNWGELNSAFIDIEQSVRLFGASPTEFLSPVTMAELRTYIPGQEVRSRRELDGLVARIVDLERSLESSGHKLNANQRRLRNRMMLLRGNTYWLQNEYRDALVEYLRVREFNPNDYYAQCSIGQCLEALGDRSDAVSSFQVCLDAVERAGDFRRKRELSTRALVAATAIVAARGCGDAAKMEGYLRDIRELLGGNVSVDGMTPRFFSPAGKRLVSAADLLVEVGGST